MEIAFLNMDPAKLVNSTAELALDLLKKRGEIVPFCKAVNSDGAVFIYTPETNDSEDIGFRKAEAHQRQTVLADVLPQKLVALAFCKEVTLTLSEPDEVLRAIRVETHHVEAKPLVYLFTFKLEAGRASILTYYTRDTDQVALWRQPN